MSKSKIEWCTDTWNVTTGCTRVSSGCNSCYAVDMTKRLAEIGATKDKYGGLVDEGKNHFNGKIKLHPGELEKPLHWCKPRMVFVNSMSDLFHPNVPFEFVDQVFAVMALAKDHTFQVLTKRPDRMAEYLNRVETSELDSEIDMRVFDPWRAVYGGEYGERIWPIPNVWGGTSVEDQPAADERIPYILRCNLAVRFLSCEPLLGPVEIIPFLGHNAYQCECGWHETEQLLFLTGYNYKTQSPRSAVCIKCGKRARIYRAIDWVIVGGESGHNARPMHPNWARSLKNQCQEAGVAFFFKQWGKWMPYEQFTEQYSHDDSLYNPLVITRKGKRYLGSFNLIEQEKFGLCEMVNTGKKKAGRLLDGREWNQMPEVVGHG